MEEQLVQQILNAPGYAELIDEMFWEHTARGNLMLAALREKGIRAHSWA